MGSVIKNIAIQVNIVPVTVWQGADGKSDSTNCVYRYINS